ncbi:hypothetical protein L596_011222 [Steinernema carpocapsae]|uniref:Transient receptor ion channel domain-containing protein n=1 Tax=Steinernema carpocapsae TaxID=34508 RepID=A0A4U5NU58_STECR|nr:hypothetical protein L596_011222 [Steinernema carpocapsae]
MTTIHCRPPQVRLAKKPAIFPSPGWTLTDETLREIAKFRAAVFANDFDRVKAILNSLTSSFTNGYQVDHLCSKICDRSSAEPLKEALLTVICIGSRPLVEYILVLFHEFPDEECSGCYDSPAFMPHLTPLVMACICNNFSIVECLLLRGHDIDLPHRIDCRCSQCFYVPNTVANNQQLLDTYRALSSEAFLWLATSDPFLSMIELSDDLRLCANAMPAYKEEYNALHQNVQSFGVAVIQQCWSMEEVDVLLRQPDGAYLTESQTHFPRIRLALDGQMRRFLAHMNVQVAVENIWHGGWTDYGCSFVRDVYRMLRHTVFYPILAFLHAISAGKLVQSFNNPIARFTSFLTSYLTFLATLIAIRYVQVYYEKSYDRNKMEMNAYFALEMYIFLYIAGMILWQFMEFARRGIDKYFEMWWRYFDFWLLCLFVFATTSFCCTLAAVKNDGLDQLHRRHWVWYDLIIIHDVFFGSGCVMAFWRILYFVQLWRNLGSTIINVGKCMQRSISYFFIMFVIMWAFAVGCNTIMEGYNGLRETLDDGRVHEQGEMFSGLIITFRNLYWAYYGYLHPMDYAITTGDAGPNFEKTYHIITNVALEITLAIYHLVIIISMLNLMIALLVKTAKEIQKYEDIEWKYSRIYIYYEYIEHSCSVPPPFNILHMITSFVYRLFSGEYVLMWPDLLVKAKMIDESGTQRINRIAYRDLQMQLFKRYRATKEGVPLPHNQGG